MNDSISELGRRVLLTGQRSAISMRLFYLLRRQAANERDRTLELVLDVANRAGTDHVPHGRHVLPRTDHCRFR